MTYLAVGLGPALIAVAGWIWCTDPIYRRIRADRRFARHHRIRGAR